LDDLIRVWRALTRSHVITLQLPANLPDAFSGPNYYPWRFLGQKAALQWCRIWCSDSAFPEKSLNQNMCKCLSGNRVQLVNWIGLSIFLFANHVR
jgi:hypothetical protein